MPMCMRINYSYVNQNLEVLGLSELEIKKAMPCFA